MTIATSCCSACGRTGSGLQALHRRVLHRELRDVGGLYLSPPDTCWCSGGREARMTVARAPQPCCPWGWATSRRRADLARATADGTCAVRRGHCQPRGGAECKPRHRPQSSSRSCAPSINRYRAGRTSTGSCDNDATHTHHGGSSPGLPARPRWAYARHSYLQLVARSGRALLRPDHRQGDPVGWLALVGQRRGRASLDHCVASYNTILQARHLDGLRRFHTSTSCIDFARVSAGQHTRCSARRRPPSPRR